MSMTKVVPMTSAVLAALAAGAIASAPIALAQDPSQCTDSGATTTVCDPNIVVTPGDVGGRGPQGANDQNGAYGPSGDAPPVGGGSGGSGGPGGS
jgi:hypothetical protein